MSDAPKKARSFERIENSDLLRLAQLALQALERAFQRRPHMRPLYEDKLIAICLCQGAAAHFVYPDPSGPGVQDFDIWAFYEQTEGIPFWNRASSHADFGHSKFGRSYLAPKRYTGRCVDIFWRSIPAEIELDPLASVRRYFITPHTESARQLRKRPAIAIWPEPHLGELIWLPTKTH